MTMRRLPLLAAVLVAAGLLGMSLQAWSQGWWGGHGWMMRGWSAGATDVGEPLAGAPSIRVEAADFAFLPDRVVVPAGEEFNLELANRGRLLHDLSVPALGVYVAAGPGVTATGGVRAAPEGEYQFLCTVPGHAAAGMVGVLVVESR